MNPNNYKYDVRFFIGFIAIVAGIGLFIYNLVWTVTTKLGSIEGAIELFCSLVGIWSIANIIGNYLLKHPNKTRLAESDVQFAIALSMAIVTVLISHFWK
ncbi:MAG: hypothetical protein ACLQUY_13310 [Ktedonobacterales bacterium]